MHRNAFMISMSSPSVFYAPKALISCLATFYSILQKVPKASLFHVTCFVYYIPVPFCCIILWEEVERGRKFIKKKKVAKVKPKCDVCIFLPFFNIGWNFLQAHLPEWQFHGLHQAVVCVQPEGRGRGLMWRNLKPAVVLAFLTQLLPLEMCLLRR